MLVVFVLPFPHESAIIGIVPLVVRPPLIGVAFLGFSDPCVEKGAFMPEKKVLPILSMVVSFVCLFDHIFFFATYSYLYLPLAASSLALIGLVQNKGRQKVWSLAGLVLAALAVAVVAYAYYDPTVIPY